MPDDFENDPHFINVEGDLGGKGMGILTRDALNLLMHGVINSCADGTPGFISDDWLNAIPAKTTIAVAELEAGGLLERRQGGYFVLTDDLVKMVIDQNEEMDRTKAECAERGQHLQHDPDESGWVVCEHCGIPLERPDGGPVALPNGGPLGPDLRNN
ncbi:hypothetical protein [Mycolicibacterium sp.]|uniref:hypothetical protein n=1 Tax=Mycolicibacterium sp. TaxID=2320850 RepID=UPI0037CBA5C7